jgi:hypothetical protein
MNDPKRMLDDADELSEAERRALVAGRDVRPPSDFAGQVWGALAMNLPPPGSVDATGGSAGAGGSGIASAGAGSAGAKIAAGTGLVSIAKAAAVGVAIGTAVVTGRAVWPASSPSTPMHGARPHEEVAAAESPHPPSLGGPIPGPSARGEPVDTNDIAPSAVRAEPPIADVPSRRAVGNESERARTDDPAKERPTSPFALDPMPIVNSMPSSAATIDDAREESRLVAAAREAVRSGDAASALASLEQARLRYPRGILVQEREALTIEALVASGRRAEAEARAAAFLRDYRRSPHTARVQAVIR